MNVIDKIRMYVSAVRGQSLGDSIGKNGMALLVSMFTAAVLVANLPHTLIGTEFSTGINTAVTTIISAFGIGAIVILILVVRSLGASSR